MLQGEAAEVQGGQRASIQRGDSMLKKGASLLRKFIPRKSRRT